MPGLLVREMNSVLSLSKRLSKSPYFPQDVGGRAFPAMRSSNLQDVAARYRNTSAWPVAAVQAVSDHFATQHKAESWDPAGHSLDPATPRLKSTISRYISSVTAFTSSNHADALGPVDKALQCTAVEIDPASHSDLASLLAASDAGLTHLRYLRLHLHSSHL